MVYPGRTTPPRGDIGKYPPIVLHFRVNSFIDIPAVTSGNGMRGYN